MMTPYMSKASLAAALEVSPGQIDNLVRLGVIPKPARLTSGCLRWRWDSVDAALRSMSERLAEEPLSPGDVTSGDPIMDKIRNAAKKQA